MLAIGTQALNYDVSHNPHRVSIVHCLYRRKRVLTGSGEPLSKSQVVAIHGSAKFVQKACMD